MGEGLQDNIGQETKDRHWILEEQQGTVQACWKQLVPWEMGQPVPATSHPAQELQGICTAAWHGANHGAPPNTQCHFIFWDTGLENKKYHLANPQQILIVVSSDFCILPMKWSEA